LDWPNSATLKGGELETGCRPAMHHVGGMCERITRIDSSDPAVRSGVVVAPPPPTRHWRRGFGASLLVGSFKRVEFCTRRASAVVPSDVDRQGISHQ